VWRIVVESQNHVLRLMRYDTTIRETGEPKEWEMLRGLSISLLLECLSFILDFSGKRHMRSLPRDQAP
jgi:hypothetical protein